MLTVKDVVMYKNGKSWISYKSLYFLAWQYM